MKSGKTPTLAQKKYIKSRGLQPDEWYVVKDTTEFMEVVSKKELARHQLRRMEGSTRKPRTRLLRKEQD